MVGLSTLAFIWNHPLNRGGRAAALLRFARWQVRSRVAGKKLQVPFVDSTRLSVSRGMTGATGNIYCGLHEHNEMGFTLHLLRPGDLFVDVGANVGSYSVLAAGAVGADVIAFEPVPATFEHLRENVAINALERRVDARNQAVGAVEGSVQFSAALGPMNHVLTGNDAAGSIDVPVVPLDAALSGRVPVLMKVDVEGFEGAVIEGGGTVFADPRLLAVIMEIGDESARYNYNPTQLRERMKSWGFSTCRYDSLSRTLSEQTGEFGHNTIFVKDAAAARERLKSAPRFRLTNGQI